MKRESGEEGDNKYKVCRKSNCKWDGTEWGSEDKREVEKDACEGDKKMER